MFFIERMEAFTMCGCPRCNPRKPTPDNIRRQEADIHRYEKGLARDEARRNECPSQPEAQPKIMGCVFAKSCNLPDGVINHNNPAGFVPLEKLANYGLWAVLGTGAAITAEGIPLKLVGGSATGNAIAQRLGGSLALVLLSGSTVVATAAAVGTVALLMPNTSLSPDSAFYKNEQYAMLDTGRTRVRINVKTLPDGSVSAYGFYTGGKKHWEFVPVIKATQEGEKFVADIGNGIGLTWTPAANPDDVLGIPALEGAPKLPTVWVYPPTEQANKVLVNPQHPPECQDAIIWFPADAGVEPIYIMLNVLPGDHSYHPRPSSFPAFQGLKRATPKTPKKGGGLRDRWKDEGGTIYEWDSQHGALEKYNKRGKHLGEFNPETGAQTKPANKTRQVEP
ncbi:colicin E3/pyocin S6 family cytotoxin [Pseudomonas brassicacearum]|uniref:colicin E3/pyocin S6 family cytotoxin n=1 Tax=Pseudomonas brassicacearum TaxID=930166 RepID=UPI00223B1706|nr:colicin E3/pyocin S6 family cytotoxin [Pseudomonas brassicacearum]